MTNIFSTVSGFFTRSLLFGALLPAAIFVILLLLFIDPLIPGGRSPFPMLGIFGEIWQVITLLILTLVVTGLLFALNSSVIRWYEGYPWENGLIGRKRKRHYQRIFQEEQARLAGIQTLLRSKPLCLPTENFNNINHWRSILKWRNLQSYPSRESLILPTRLGNAIRSFETYPDEQYGMEAITLWPRLVAVIDEEYADTISDAKASFDFMLNSSLLNAILCLGVLFIGLLFPLNTFSSPSTVLTWLTIMALFGLASYLFYLGTIPSAVSWGETVKGAFDIYRWALLRQLGFQQIPTTRRDERTLWHMISMQLLYRDRPEGPQPPTYGAITSQPNTVVDRIPTDVAVSVTRSLLPGNNNQDLAVAVEVRNDDCRRTISNLIITDTIPDGFGYEYDTASAEGQKVTVEGINPYRFHMGCLPPQRAVQLTYRVVRWPRP